MRTRKRLCGALLVIAALVIMQLPVSEADAETSSASDFKMEGSTLIKYRGKDKNVSVPNTVEVIAEKAFEENDTIELVVLPDSVKRIEPYSFWGCDNLDTVVLGKGLTQVGDYAFAGCKGLEQMSIPSNIASIGIMAFGDCVNLKDISIPAETADIHDTAFDGCSKLTIHCDKGSAADIFARAFYEKQQEMPEYQDVPSSPLPSPAGTASPAPSPAPDGAPAQDLSSGRELGSTKIVGNRAVVFLNGGALNVYGASSFSPSPAPEQTPGADFGAGTPEGGIPKYTVVDGKVVADQAYYGNDGIRVAALPEGIREIGQFSFARSALTEISLPQGVETISYGAFYHCDDLKDVELPDTVMLVEPKAFEHTGWVDGFLNGDGGQGDYLISGGVLIGYRGAGGDVSVPEGVRVIAAEAFIGCGGITSVTLPESLRVIGEGAFEDCAGLREITLNEGLEQIKDRAFLNCGAETVRVPASVKEVGLRALEGMEAEYAGEAPEMTYEVSATRLSNEDYRAPEPDAEAIADGVTVEEPEGASAVLEGAARSYILQILPCQDTKPMTDAFRRVFGMQPPESALLYDMSLADASGIPLHKLGRQMLTVEMPLPDSLAGQELRFFSLDRNGQLEEHDIEHVVLNGAEAVRFSVNQVSAFALCPTGAALSGMPTEISVERKSMGAPPVERAEAPGFFVKSILAGAVLATGLLLIFVGRRKPFGPDGSCKRDVGRKRTVTGGS